MKYGSVCSGVEAATVAWHHMGWKPSFYSEIDKFPSAVLQHHYPNVPNLGDMNNYKEWKHEPIDLLVGGTPCQSFSVAGLREGLNSPNGNLMLTYLAMADRLKPKWVVWENVPGVLSSNKGKDFGTFLSALGEIGYGFAYRVLDAQYFGLAQRRKRVFVVGYLGDWRRAATVLFEPESLSGDTPPGREEGKKVAPTVVTGPPFCRPGGTVETETYQPVITDSVIGTLDSECGGSKLSHQTIMSGHLIPEAEVSGTVTARMMNALGARDVEEGAVQVVGSFSNGGFGSYKDSNGVSATLRASGGDYGNGSEVLSSETHSSDTYSIISNIIGKDDKNGGNGLGIKLNPNDPMYTLTTSDIHAVTNHLKVRRLTPIETERLQGFPDNYTQIPWRNKQPEDCPDGPRYKAMGNSMAVPVMRWIGERIQMVEGVSS